MKTCNISERRQGITFDSISMSIFPMVEDEYTKYDPEPNADQFLTNSGATILHSEIEITDSQGRNRRIVRRRNDNGW